MRSILIVLSILLLITCTNENKNASTSEQASVKLFNELWETFDKNYAFFELRGVDWEAERKMILPKLSEINKDTLLFYSLCDLLKKFKDTHINLESDQLNLFCNAGELPNFLMEFPSNESFALFLKARDQTLAKVGIKALKDSDSNIFQYGLSPNQEWGYFRIKRFYGASLEEIRLELDAIMKVLGNVNQLIIDIRVNPGGNDETALLVAGYFFEQKEIAFIKKVRNGAGYEDFTKPDTTYVTPISSLKNRHTSLYLLTNRASGSSADVFALIMSYLPNLTIVGKNTEGIFSNMYRDTLSNGWRFTLSNERYYSKDMKCYEKMGVPVDIAIENRREEVEKGMDNVIEAVIK